MIWFFIIMFLWLLFNVCAPYAILLKGKPVSRGRLPSELLTGIVYRKVQFYMADLRGGYGYSVWAPPKLNLVVFDRKFFQHASPMLIRFVIAHELAHFGFGHHRRRWAYIVTGLALLPAVRRRLLKMEDEADAEATRRTGYKRSNFEELKNG